MASSPVVSKHPKASLLLLLSTSPERETRVVPQGLSEQLLWLAFSFWKANRDCANGPLTVFQGSEESISGIVHP